MHSALVGTAEAKIPFIMNDAYARIGCGELIRFKGADTAAVQHAIDELQAKLGGTAKVNLRLKVKQRRPWWKFWGA